MANAFDEKILGERQKIALAQKLRESGQEIPQGRMVGDRFVGASWTQGLAQALKQGLGAYQESQAENKIKELEGQRTKGSIEALGAMGIKASPEMLMQAGTKEQKPSMFSELGGALGFIDKPETIPAQPYQQNVAQNVTPDQFDTGALSLYGSDPTLAAAALAMSGAKATRAATAERDKYERDQDKLKAAAAVEAARLQREFLTGEHELTRAATAANRPIPQAEAPVAIMGADGKPTYVSRNQAIGQTPYTATTAKQDAQDVAAATQKTQATLSAQQVLDNGANLLLHPGRSMATGASGMLPTIPGTDARDFEKQLDTYKAQTFVPMVSALKGMGALSDAEGKKLTESVGSLERSMSEEGFKNSLKKTNKFLFDKAKAAGLNVQLPSGLDEVNDIHSEADAILGRK